MPAKIQKKRSRLINRILLPITLVVLVAISWLSYRSMLSPSGINEVLFSTGMLTGDTSTASNGSWTIPENPAPKNIPADCISWFDGCNTCGVKDGQLTGCTRKACEKFNDTRTDSSLEKAGPAISPAYEGDKYAPEVQYDQRPAQCLAYAEGYPKSTTPPNQFCTMEAGSCIGNDGSCVGYKDGCQKIKVCAADQSQSSKCETQKPFPTTTPEAPAGCYYKQVQCVQAPCEPLLVCETTSSTNIPRDCLSWFDGCNTCIVKDGQLAGCTKMACKERIGVEPYCKTYDDSMCVKVTGSCINPSTNACVSYTNECEGTRLCGKTLPWSKCDPNKPSPTAVPTGTPEPTAMPVGPALITSFEASEPCNSVNAIEPSFKTYRYICLNGTKHEDSFCRSFDEEMFIARATCKE